MATKKEITRQLLKGVIWNDICSSPGCGKSTVARCAATRSSARKLGLREDARPRGEDRARSVDVHQKWSEWSLLFERRGH